MTAQVAGAPVSFGVFEMTPEGAEVMLPDDMLDILSAADYTGVDLGPVGYFGRGSELRLRLESRKLALAGGWVELPFTDDDAFAAALSDLDDALAIFSEAAHTSPSSLLPKPTLADHGSPSRKLAPGRGAQVHPLTESAENRLIANAQRAADRVRKAGFEPTFHHHAGTFVESPEEIERFLDRVDIGLTLDTGHLLIGGGDPLQIIEQWGHRINHLHLKDVNSAELHRVLQTGGGMTDVWSSGAFVALGKGALGVAPVMEAMFARGYDGWVVVEQDVLNAPGISLADFRVQRRTDQQHNREALRTWC